ncbi:WecB/TagA/CpsF family glycosyltransferase [Arenibacterium sp. LLYu02]|uniref:WecB/TagA/CpsF family glycosyltransferase n=1 Tax=Arenibacterium sp. LLYu02 TaxID=3404132 RepID=UPI003B228707
MYPNLETVRVGGFPTVLADRTELSSWIGDVCQSNPALPALVFSSNGQGIALYGQNPAYDAAMEAADVIHADGMPVVMASKWLTTASIRGRSATTDLFHDVAKVAQKRGLKFFVLGSTEEQNRKAVEQMKVLYPEVQIVGRRNGYFSDAENAEICAEIVASGADVLWVGLGKPKQEIWCLQNRAALAGVGVKKNLRWALCLFGWRRAARAGMDAEYGA